MAGEMILIVEDEAVIAMDLQGLLEQLGYRAPTIAADADEALAAAAAARPDLVLLDINLGGGRDGISVAEELRRRWELPVIFLTAHADAATVSRAKAVQPYHYLLKPFAERELAIAVELALAKSASDQALRASEQRFATTLRAIAEGVIVADAAGRISFVNPVAEQLTGWRLSEAVGNALATVLVTEAAEERRPLAELASQVMRERRAPDRCGEVTLIRRDGARRIISLSLAPIVDAVDEVSGVVVVFRDETARRALEDERRAMERKLLETQRRESLGMLAGGIAHDFNNLLSIVQGQIDLAMLDLKPDTTLYHALQQALTGLHRAADLASQMLAYSGRGHMLMEPLDLNALVHDVNTLLYGSLARHTTVILQLADDLPTISGDATQIRQVVLNLLTNAAEAASGADSQITVTTRLESLSAEQLQHYNHGDELAAGRYICLEVRDHGCGMDAATLVRIFDPFFTTKRVGRGLGLAAVHGIVRGHRGAIQVSSTPNMGTSFRVVLPAQTAGLSGIRAPALAATPAASSADSRGALLVVDDEAGVRDILARYLKRMGFVVVVAESGQAALERLAGGITHLQGLLIDLTMPGMGGDQLAAQVRADFPGIPIMLMSGYRAEEVTAQYAELGMTGFLQKPFRYDTLNAALTTMLGESK
jgi:two-component system, cell cycle sensor histidine kinase and response regulator CckA